MIKVEQIIEKNEGSWSKAKYRKVNSIRARQYIRSVVPRQQIDGIMVKYEKGEYCENCGAVFETEVNPKQSYKYRKFFVCKSCRDDLKKERKTGIPLSVPNINDLFEEEEE